MSIAVLKPSRLQFDEGAFDVVDRGEGDRMEHEIERRRKSRSPGRTSGPRPRPSGRRREPRACAPMGSTSLRTRRSIFSPGRCVNPISAPSSSSFRVIAQAMLKSLATPSTSPFFPVNIPIGDPFRLPWPGRSLALAHRRASQRDVKYPDGSTRSTSTFLRSVASHEQNASRRISVRTTVREPSVIGQEPEESQGESRPPEC